MSAALNCGSSLSRPLARASSTWLGLGLGLELGLGLGLELGLGLG